MAATCLPCWQAAQGDPVSHCGHCPLLLQAAATTQAEALSPADCRATPTM